ncbi:MAG: ABC transporter substrate-binding protein [Solirubrobacterales bacterium]
MRLRLTALAALIAASLSLVACGGGSSSSSATGGSTSASGSGGELTTVKMVQEWPVADGFWIPWILGKEKGFYEEAGINLEIIAPATEADTMKLLGTGQADVAFTTIMDVLFAREAGAEVTAIGRYSSGNNWGVISREGEPLTPAELKGKTIGIYNDAWTRAQLSMVLASAGLTLDDVKTVVASDDTVPLLLENKVDAITGLTTAEGAEIVGDGKKYEFLEATKYGVPDSPVLMFAANDDWLHENEALGKKFMAATERSLEYAIANPQEGIEAYVNAYGEAEEKSFLTEQWHDTIELFSKSPDGSYFSMDDQMWAPLLEAVKENGVVEKTFPPADYYTNKLLGV